MITLNLLFRLMLDETKLLSNILNTLNTFNWMKFMRRQIPIDFFFFFSCLLTTWWLCKSKCYFMVSKIYRLNSFWFIDLNESFEMLINYCNNSALILTTHCIIAYCIIAHWQTELLRLFRFAYSPNLFSNKIL